MIKKVLRVAVARTSRLATVSFVMVTYVLATLPPAELEGWVWLLFIILATDIAVLAKASVIYDRLVREGKLRP